MSTLAEEGEVERVGLQEATHNVLEECRMVLPGVQALFGFQLISVFNQGFEGHLSHREQQAHLVALMMSAMSVALLMAPAAYHRQAHPKSVSREHLRASSWMLTLGMLPLMIAILIDIYLVARVIAETPLVAGVLTGIVGSVFMFLWVIFPRYKRYKRKGSAL